MNEIKHIIEEDTHIKDFIFKNYSKKFYGYLKSNKTIFIVNNNEVGINTYLKNNDILIIKYQNKNKETIKIDKEINILYEDNYLIILDKPHGLLTIPSINDIDSLYSRLLFHRGDFSLNVITRLDKLTSGIVVVAKKHFLVEQINSNIILKEYLAKTDKLLTSDNGIINLPIMKSDSTKRVVDELGKEAVTHYKLIKKEKHIYSLILKTGRTHQIRVHLSYNDAPIKGDELYGGSRSSYLHLNCNKVILFHPITKEELSITSNLWSD